MKISAQLVITVLSKSMTSISIFVLSVILSRYFTKDDYGTYLHVQLIANLATWAFLLGIPHGIYYFLPKINKKRKYVLTVIAIISSIAVLVSGLVFSTVDSLSELLSNPRIESLGYVLLFMVLLKIPVNIFEPLMISVGRVKEFASVELIMNVSFFLAVVIPVSIGSDLIDILWWIVGMYCLQSIVVFYYAITIAMKFGKYKEDGDEIGMAEQLKYTFPIGLSMNAFELSHYIDKIVVSNQTSAEDYAVYARGALEIPVIGIIANTLDNLLMPKFVEAYKNNDIAGIMKSWHATIRMMAAFIYPCCLFLIISAPLLIPAIFSEKYSGSIIIFQIYTLSLLSRLSTFNVIMRAIGKTKIILWVALSSIVINLIFTYLFMMWWGLIGAPIATVLTLLILRSSYLFAITHYFNISLKDVFPWPSILKSLVISCLASVPILLLMQYSFDVWLHLLLLFIVYSVSYLGLLRLIPSLTASDKDGIRDFLHIKIRWIV